MAIDTSGIDPTKPVHGNPTTASVRNNTDAIKTAINTASTLIDARVVGPGSAVDSDIAVFDGTTGKLIKDSGVKVSDLQSGPYDTGGYIPGTYTSSQVIYAHVFARSVEFPSGLSGSEGYAIGANATSSAVFTVAKNGASVGSMTFGAATATATFSAASAISCAAGDRMTVTAPSSADSTLAGITFTLKGTR